MELLVHAFSGATFVLRVAPFGTMLAHIRACSACFLSLLAASGSDLHLSLVFSVSCAMTCFLARVAARERLSGKRSGLVIVRFRRVFCQDMFPGLCGCQAAAIQKVIRTCPMLRTYPHAYFSVLMLRVRLFSVDAVCGHPLLVPWEAVGTML